MTIQEWLKSDCDYQIGVELYAKHGRNKNLLRRFRRLENAALASKLKYELSKIVNPDAFNSPSKPIQKSPKPIVFTPPKIKVERPVDIKKPEESPVLKKMKSKPISFYPIELHPIYHRRINSFLQACSLKVQLNELEEDETEKAFEIQFKIFSLFEINDKCWTILRHFEETGRVMPLKASVDYSQLNPMDLLRIQQNIYVRISKRKKTIKKTEQTIINSKEPGRIERLKQNVLKKKEELQQLENDLEAIAKLIQG